MCPIRETITGFDVASRTGLAAHIALETGLEVVIVRPPLVYGPGVKGNFAQMIKVLAKGIPLPLASVRNLRSLVNGNL